MRAESDLLEDRLLRTQAVPITRVTWESEATAINRLYDWLVSLRRWDREDFHRYIRHQADRIMRGSVNEHVVVIKALHQIRAVLT
ncbi:hypothetical protein [Nocardia sp. CNY236]|uniref:hypothetical protein n=1 Tax=Nocardia sp. CNY236 TaxID=1169152 RepID=UPI0012DCA2C6|nr:hypothetical protein [Nocardia sp. CNY236]